MRTTSLKQLKEEQKKIIFFSKCIFTKEKRTFLKKVKEGND